jgi:ribosomal protein S18 acetylase RimI-like enzyme
VISFFQQIEISSLGRIDELSCRHVMDDHDPTHQAASEPRLFAEYFPRSTGWQREPLPENLLITQATERDVEGIARLVMDRQGIANQDATKRVERWLLADADKSLFLIARLKDAVAAYARAAFIPRPMDSDFAHVPEGWYLTGVVVADDFRRRGIASELTRRRLDWIAQRAPEAFYFASARNRASIDLHQRHGFMELQHNFRFPGVQFTGGVGILFRAAIPLPARE